MNTRSCNNFFLNVLVIVLCYSFYSNAFSNDRIENPRSLVSTCYSCHGIMGNSVGSMKSLNGYDSKKFVSKFKWFSKNPSNGGVMHHIAKGFTNNEINIMANFFYSQK